MVDEVTVLAMVVEPVPDIVPPVQEKVDVTVRLLDPVSVPLRIERPATVTGASTVTVMPELIVASSAAPGTPAPPQVVALLQCPVVLAVKEAANARGAASAEQMSAQTAIRAIKEATRPMIMRTD